MKKIMVFIGPGGVGKTTTAAAVALREAEKGKKVLVLTIDPSKRLAQTLGIEGSSEPTRVPGFSGSGELWASLIDHQKTFDDFVTKASRQTPGVERLLKNKLYRQMTTTLAGSQDFSALEKLYSSYTEGNYDLIVLDTPPAQHALTFLEAPEKIAALFSEGVAKWFREAEGTEVGFFRRVVGMGTRQVLKILETLTGSDFVRELAEFFRSIEGWQSRLQARTNAVHNLLISESTEFFLVTSFDPVKRIEAEALAQEIRRRGYGLRGVLINRVFPEWFQESRGRSGDVALNKGVLSQLQKDFEAFYQARKSSVQNFGTGLKGQVSVVQLPELNERVYDLKGLNRVANLLEEGGWP